MTDEFIPELNQDVAPTYQEVVNAQKLIKRYYSHLGKRSVDSRDPKTAHDKEYFSTLGKKSAEVKKERKLKKKEESEKKTGETKKSTQKIGILTRLLTGKAI